jgi:cytochrome c556
MEHHFPEARMNAKPAVISFVALLLAGTLALAHEGVTGVIKERMDLMERQKDDMKIIGDMANGKTPFDAAKAAEAARDISLTSKKIPELFPEGSLHEKSEALPAIWENFDRFTANAEDLDEAADALAASLEAANPEWKAAFQKVTDACKACHQDFRAKKKEKHH